MSEATSPVSPPAPSRRPDGLAARLAEVPAAARRTRRLWAAASALRGEPITVRAAALTYLTVLSLVPLLAVVFSIFQAVVGTSRLRSELQAFILQNLAVGNRANVQHYIEDYVRRATGATLGGVGFVLLVASSISLMMNVEAAFNHIFRAPRKRPLALRFGIYWCLLTVGPILLALSIAGTAVVGAHLKGLVRPLVGFGLPLAITIGGFALLYFILPALPVKRRAALFGAAMAGTMWELAKVAFTWFAAHSVRTNAIYGSISAVPTFLVWTYLSWLIVLFGARLAAAAQAGSLLPSADGQSPPVVREIAVARVMAEIARAFQGHRPPPATRTIALALALDDGFARSCLKLLAEAGLVHEAGQGGFVPARPLSQIRLADLRRAARGRLDADSVRVVRLTGELARLATRWEEADGAADERLATTLEEHLAGAERAT